MSEFRGYEDRPAIALGENGGKIAVSVGNSVMIDAYKAGMPDNGKPFPDGAKMAKIHWNPKKQTTYPGQPTVPGTQHDVDFMVKDSKRFADSGGRGWGAFDYDVSGAIRVLAVECALSLRMITGGLWQRSRRRVAAHSRGMQPSTTSSTSNAI